MWRDQAQLALRLTHINQEVPGIILINKVYLWVASLLSGPEACVNVRQSSLFQGKRGTWEERPGMVVSIAIWAGSGAGEAFKSSISPTVRSR